MHLWIFILLLQQIILIYFITNRKMKTTSQAFLLFAITAIIFSNVQAQQCTVDQSLRTDCGYMGINQQQCQTKGCCWKPVNFLKQQQQHTVAGVPWCFYPAGSNPCENITYNQTGGPGFNTDFYNKMYALFDVNINIQGKGGIVAAPDPNTPGGSYYYHWMRDAALTMRTYMEINDMKLSAIQTKMKAYVDWVRRVQAQSDPNGFDIRINPKFQLPNGQVYVGGWCRPQTDGPGLRSAALMTFGNLLIAEGQSSYVTNTLLQPIKFDLEWVLNNWQQNGCDLWQQVRSTDFFWNRAGFVYALDLCQSFFTKVGDSATASRCASTKSSVQASLDKHWTGAFITQSSNRQKDSAVIHAFSSFNVYSLTDNKVAKTIQTLALTFCSQYAINQQDTKAGLPGVLMGRYPGDSYAGGNPWQLLTAVLAKTFYQGASTLMQQEGFQQLQDQHAWGDLLKVPRDASTQEFVKAAINAGDSVMSRLYKYVKNDGGHIAEQIGKNSGAQASAKDLTWSYANILSAMKEREKVKEAFSLKYELKQE